MVGIIDLIIIRSRVAAVQQEIEEVCLEHKGFTGARLDISVPKRTINGQLQQPRTIKSKAPKGSDSSGI